MTTEAYDAAILGAGSAAFAAASAAVEAGARVALIERDTIGGTCVNRGCVPSKSLIRAAEAVHQGRSTPFAGIDVSARIASFPALADQQRVLIDHLRRRKYLDLLAEMPGVTVVRGHARFTSDGAIDVAGRTLHVDRCVIAAGARPRLPAIPWLAQAGVLTSTSALALSELPRSLAVIGAGFVAMELAQAYARLGVAVTILHRGHRILSELDADVAVELTEALRAEGVEIVTDVTVTAIDRLPDGRRLTIERADGERQVAAQEVLVATGRQPNSADLGLERAGVAVDAAGHVVVDDHLRTTAPWIYAAGDVIGPPAFVYTAAYEGRLAMENALGRAPRPRDYRGVPWVIFTDPQIAVVGLDEPAAARTGVPVEVAKLPLAEVPRAIVARRTRGFIKLLRRGGTDRLVGAVIVAPEAGDLIMEPTLAIRHGIGVSQLAAAFHPYLTQAEGVRLAAQSFTRDVARLSCCAD